jgi:hypothetical protein
MTSTTSALERMYAADSAWLGESRTLREETNKELGEGQTGERERKAEERGNNEQLGGTHTMGMTTLCKRVIDIAQLNILRKNIPSVRSKCKKRLPRREL